MMLTPTHREILLVSAVAVTLGAFAGFVVGFEAEKRAADEAAATAELRTRTTELPHPSVLTQPPVWTVQTMTPPTTTTTAPTVEPTPRIVYPASRYAWPSLGMDKTIALSEILKGISEPPRVVIWCPGIDCVGLESDLDDAFQLAGWESNFDRRRVDSNDDVGLSVGPPNDHSKALAAAIEKTTGMRVKLVEAPQADSTINLYIGKRLPVLP